MTLQDFHLLPALDVPETNGVVNGVDDVMTAATTAGDDSTVTRKRDAIDLLPATSDYSAHQSHFTYLLTTSIFTHHVSLTVLPSLKNTKQQFKQKKVLIWRLLVALQDPYLIPSLHVPESD